MKHGMRRVFDFMIVKLCLFIKNADSTMRSLVLRCKTA